MMLLASVACYSKTRHSWKSPISSFLLYTIIGKRMWCCSSKYSFQLASNNI